MTDKGPTRGHRWLAEVEDAYDLNEAERVLTIEAASVMDEIDALPGSAVVERRMQRTLLARLLSALALPEADTGERKPTASQRASKAARVRWSGRTGEAV